MDSTGNVVITNGTTTGWSCANDCTSTITRYYNNSVANQLTQADIDRLHTSGLIDALGLVLFWVAEGVGTIVLALVVAYGISHTLLWLRDLHRLVRTSRSKGVEP